MFFMMICSFFHLTSASAGPAAALHLLCHCRHFFDIGIFHPHAILRNNILELCLYWPAPQKPFIIELITRSLFCWKCHAAHFHKRSNALFIPKLFLKNNKNDGKYIQFKTPRSCHLLLYIMDLLKLYFCIFV